MPSVLSGTLEPRSSEDLATLIHVTILDESILKYSTCFVTLNFSLNFYYRIWSYMAGSDFLLYLHVARWPYAIKNMGHCSSKEKKNDDRKMHIRRSHPDGVFSQFGLVISTWNSFTNKYWIIFFFLEHFYHIVLHWLLLPGTSSYFTNSYIYLE